MSICLLVLGLASLVEGSDGGSEYIVTVNLRSYLVALREHNILVKLESDIGNRRRACRGLRQTTSWWGSALKLSVVGSFLFGS